MNVEQKVMMENEKALYRKRLENNQECEIFLALS